MQKNLLPLLLLGALSLSNVARANEEAAAEKYNDLISAADSLEELAATSLVEHDKSSDKLEYQYNPGDVLYIATNGLRVRAEAAQNGKALGMLSLNDKVTLVSGEIVNGFLEIVKPRTVNSIVESEKYFIAADHVSMGKTDYKEFTGNRFVIVNFATETLRVYERECADNSCPHKMIMETEVVAGEDKNLPAQEKGKGRSILGSYRLTGWAKFYQDAGGHYPAWYKAGSPNVPAYGTSDWNDWFKNKHMPVNPANGKRDGSMRGAFGWYAAFQEPNAYGQWLHGTIGWGADKDRYIQQTKKLTSNIFSNPRSSGCTRNNNEAIAYIRHLVGIGTPIIKIYAKEALLDKSLRNYTNPYKTWDYILTKNSGQTSDRESVEAALKVSRQEVDLFWANSDKQSNLPIDPKSPLSSIIEVGTYTVDVTPTPISFTSRKAFGKWKRQSTRDGNLYGVKDANMSNGIFYVDAGLVTGNYFHPTAILEVGGFEDEVIPAWMNYEKVLLSK